MDGDSLLRPTGSGLEHPAFYLGFGIRRAGSSSEATSGLLLGHGLPGGFFLEESDWEESEEEERST